MGALTSDARAEDRVAEKIPAVISGPKAETRLITWTTHTHTHTGQNPAGPRTTTLPTGAISLRLLIRLIIFL